MQLDIIEIFHGQTIQHGKFNDRIYLMKFNPDSGDHLPTKLIELAREKQYSKIFAKIPQQQAKAFLQVGFQCEAIIPDFYNGKQTACLLGYYINSSRQQPATAQVNEQVIKVCRQKQQEKLPPVQLPDSMTLRPCTPEDVSQMARLYQKVFASYPFPIDDPDYIRQTMATHVDYFGIWQAGQLIALSSAEMDMDWGNVEMTDFATDPEARGASLAMILLAHMEQAMQAKHITTAYTIARAASFGMNITFAKLGYTFGGRLINNTQIGGQFEDMNVWFKALD